MLAFCGSPRRKQQGLPAGRAQVAGHPHSIGFCLPVHRSGLHIVFLPHLYPQFSTSELAQGTRHVLRGLIVVGVEVDLGLSIHAPGKGSPLNLRLWSPLLQASVQVLAGVRELVSRPRDASHIPMREESERHGEGVVAAAGHGLPSSSPGPRNHTAKESLR